MQNLQLVVETDTDKFKLTAKAYAERFKINMIKENSHAQPWWRRTRLHSAKFPICEREKPKKLSAPTKKLQTKDDKCCIGLWDLSQADRQTWQSSCGSVLAIINRHKYKDPAIFFHDFKPCFRPIFPQYFPFVPFQNDTVESR